VGIFFKALGQQFFLEKLGGFWFSSAVLTLFFFFKQLLPLFLQNPSFYKIHDTADSELSTLSLGLKLLCKSFQLLEFLAFYDNLGGYSHSWVSKSGGPTTYFS
jgi:hypothetical protein